MPQVLWRSFFATSCPISAPNPSCNALLTLSLTLYFYFYTRVLTVSWQNIAHIQCCQKHTQKPDLTIITSPLPVWLRVCQSTVNPKCWNTKSTKVSECQNYQIVEIWKCLSVRIPKVPKCRYAKSVVIWKCYDPQCELRHNCPASPCGLPSAKVTWLIGWGDALCRYHLGTTLYWYHPPFLALQYCFYTLVLPW